MKTKSLEASVQEGWAVHIYDHRRHLCCTLDASHSWSFVTGAAIGTLLTIMGTAMVPPSPSQAEQPSSTDALVVPSPVETSDQGDQENHPIFWND